MSPTFKNYASSAEKQSLAELTLGPAVNRSRGIEPHEGSRRGFELCTGAFVEEARNVLAFGLPGLGKAHAVAAPLSDRGQLSVITPY